LLLLLLLLLLVNQVDGMKEVEDENDQVFTDDNTFYEEFMKSLKSKVEEEDRKEEDFFKEVQQQVRRTNVWIVFYSRRKN
jgi:hypothetical protein